jgi:hypothetical protein
MKKQINHMKKNLFLLSGLFALALSVSAQEQNESRTIVHSTPLVKYEESVVYEGRDTVKTINSEAESSVFLDGSLNTDLVFFWKRRARKAEHGHWNGFKFAFVNLEGLEGADIRASQSYSVSLMPVSTQHAFDRHWLFLSGVGLDWTRYHFREDVGLQGKSGFTHFEPVPEDVSYKSSKLLTYYATIPLVFEYQTKVSNHTFYIDGGVEGLLKYYSKSQVDIRTSKGVEKTSLGRDLNILPVNMRFVLQMGINDTGIFGYYQPFSMFEKGKGPDVRSFGIGICLK